MKGTFSFFYPPSVSKSLLIVLGTLSSASHEMTVRSAASREFQCIPAMLDKPAKRLILTSHRPTTSKTACPHPCPMMLTLKQSGRCGRRNSFMLLVLPAHTTRLSISINMVNRSALFPWKELTVRRCSLIGYSKRVSKIKWFICSHFSPSLNLNINLSAMSLDGQHAETARACGLGPHIPLACFFGILLSLFISALFYCTVRRFALFKAHGFIHLPAIVIRQMPNPILPDMGVSLENSCPSHRYFFKRGKKPALPNGDGFRPCGHVLILLCDFSLHPESPHDRMRVNLMARKDK